MARKIHVQVGDDEIKLGMRGSGWFCPIALALSWRLPAHKEIDEDGTISFYALQWIIWRPPKPGHPCIRQRPTRQLIGEIGLPAAAVEWMKRFDAGEKPPPFEFDLEIPDALEKVLWRSHVGDQG